MSLSYFAFRLVMFFRWYVFVIFESRSSSATNLEWCVFVSLSAQETSLALVEPSESIFAIRVSTGYTLS